MIRSVALAAVVVATVAGSTWDPAEQAQRGRTAWRNAVTALRSGDSTTALTQLRLAHEAWPAQPAYSETLVRLAARLGDTTTVASALRVLAAQGLGVGVSRDSFVVRMAERSGTVAAQRTAVERAGTGPERSTAAVVNADTVFFPEGLDIDARDGTRFITSLRHRNVWVLPTSGAGRWLLPANVDGRGAVFGVKLAPDGQSLWLSLASSAHMGRRTVDSAVVAEVIQVERATGRVLRRATLGDGKGVPGELTLHDDGSVLVSDATLGKLYRLRRGAERVETIEHPLLRSPQGIAVLGGKRDAIVADWSHGLLRWNLETNAITALETPNTMALLGIDGLLRVGSELIAVQNGVQPMRVLRIAIDESATRVVSAATIDRPQESRGEFTIAAVRGNELSYIASSSWPFWNDEAVRLPNSGALPPVTLRTLRLR
jgi:hypothetical protein